MKNLQYGKFRCILIAAVSLFLTLPVTAQNGVAINTTNSPANASAILDVASGTKGVLLPRMTASERGAISSPATGLTVYQTDGSKGYYHFNGSAWVRIGDAADISGVIPVANGGTGNNSLTANGVLYGSGTGAVNATPASTAANSYLTTVTAGGVPSWTVPQVPQFISLQNTVSSLPSTGAYTIGGNPVWSLGTSWTPSTILTYQAITAMGTSEFRTNKSINLNNLRLTGWIENQSGLATGNITIYLMKYSVGAVTNIPNYTSSGIGGTSLGSVTINMSNATTTYLYDLNIGSVALVQGDVIVPVIYNSGGSTRSVYTSGKIAWTVDLGTTLN